MAKLIYTTEPKHIETVEKICTARGLVCSPNVTDAAKLRSLQSCDVLLVSDPLLLRGFDFRSDSGVALLLATPLDSKRAFMQALGRVGRMGEKCKRILL